MVCPRFTGVLQVPSSFFLETKISSPPNPGHPADEKYKVFPSACINGDFSSYSVLMESPRFTGTFHFPFLSRYETQTSLLPFPPLRLLTKYKAFPSGEIQGW